MEEEDPTRKTLLDRLEQAEEYIEDLEWECARLEQAPFFPLVHAKFMAAGWKRLAAKRERDVLAAEREADRLRHGEEIESDYICPGDLRAHELTETVAELRMSLRDQALETVSALGQAQEAHETYRDALVEALSASINGEDARCRRILAKALGASTSAPTVVMGAPSGVFFEAAASRALDLAVDNFRGVVFEFNGTKVWVFEGDTVESLWNQYREQREVEEADRG